MCVKFDTDVGSIDIACQNLYEDLSSFFMLSSKYSGYKFRNSKCRSYVTGGYQYNKIFMRVSSKEIKGNVEWVLIVK